MQRFLDKTEKTKIFIGVILAVIVLGSIGIVASRSTTKKVIEPAQLEENTNPEGHYAEERTAASKILKEKKPENAPVQKAAEDSNKNTEHITILAGDVTVKLSVPANTIFYDALVEAESEGKVAFSGKQYPALGFFVTDIGTLHRGDGKDLLYYINGKEANVGVSQYVLKDGDVIEWRLE